MGARQLPRRGRADSRDPRRPAVAVSTASCPSWRKARSPDFRGCSASPGPTSRTPTAASSPSRCVASCAPIKPSQPLTIGELWAVAITLRVVMVENLRRVAQRIVISRAARQEADALADRLLGVNGQTADPQALERWRRPQRPAHARVRGAAGAAPARPGSRRSRPRCCGWTKNCARSSSIRTRVVRDEHQRQGASNVTVRNIITSMRLMSDVDWSEFFESVSLVDEALHARPTSPPWTSPPAICTAAPSRSWRAARRMTELEIARRVLRRAAAPAATEGARARSGLLPDLRWPRQARARPSATARGCEPGRARHLRPWAPPDYVAAIAFTAALLLSLPLALLQHAGVRGTMALVVGLPRRCARHGIARGAGQPRGDARRAAPRRCRAWRCATACRRSCAPWS